MHDHNQSVMGPNYSSKKNRNRVVKKWSWWLYFKQFNSLMTLIIKGIAKFHSAANRCEKTI
jgi:hypothetical protein